MAITNDGQKLYTSDCAVNGIDALKQFDIWESDYHWNLKEMWIDVVYDDGIKRKLVVKRKYECSRRNEMTDLNLYHVGDKVTVVNRSSRHNGKHGTIERILYKVRFDDGSDSAFVEDSIAYMSRQEETNESNDI